MGLLDRLFGKSESQQQPGSASKESQLTDEQALERYRYLLRTAPPEAIEQAHAEAFAQLTPEQRAQALKQLSQQVPAAERASVPSQADPQSLARLATRAELRQPGILERTFGGSGMGMGMGGVFAGSLLGSIAGSFIGSAIAHQFLGGFHGGGWRSDSRDSDSGRTDSDATDAQASSDDAGGDDVDADDSADYGDSGDDAGGDFGDL